MIVELIAESGETLCIHQQFWRGALFVAEQFGGWRPRLTKKGRFSRESNQYRLAQVLAELNEPAYKKLIRFLTDNRSIRITNTAISRR